MEVTVQEAAAELAAVNEALAEEIDERRDLERRLSDSDKALSTSRAQERRARHEALHDAVTGLPNMTLFHDRLDNALAQAHRHARPFAVLFVDLDEFKSVNDKHGHDIGDRVLQMMARRLRASIRRGRHCQQTRWGRVCDTCAGRRRADRGGRLRLNRRECRPSSA